MEKKYTFVQKFARIIVVLYVHSSSIHEMSKAIKRI